MGKSTRVVGVEDFVNCGLTVGEAQEIDMFFKEGRAKGLDPSELWRELVSRRLLKPSHPHRLHQLVYHSVYSHWEVSTKGPPPYWFPSV